MKYAYIDATGVVTGLNREGQAGELTGICTPQELVWGMVSEYYTSPAGALVPKTQAEINIILAERVLLTNAAKAQTDQAAALAALNSNTVSKAHGLPATMSDEDVIETTNYVQLLQGDIDNPSDDEAYNPPLPPGVTPPAYDTITVTISRVDGWQGNLGYRAVISSIAEGFTPTSLALAIYSAENCDGYLYTTGAFQLDIETGEWFAICPPGQEPGDANIFIGVLYGSAPLGCFTLPAGQTTKVVNVYEAI